MHFEGRANRMWGLREEPVMTPKSWPEQLGRWNCHQLTGEFGEEVVRSSALDVNMKYQLVNMCLLYIRLRSFKLSNFLGRYYYSDFTNLEMIV